MIHTLSGIAYFRIIYLFHRFYFQLTQIMCIYSFKSQFTSIAVFQVHSNGQLHITDFKIDSTKKMMKSTLNNNDFARNSRAMQTISNM